MTHGLYSSRASLAAQNDSYHVVREEAHTMVSRFRQLHIKTAGMSTSANYTKARDALGADLEELTWRPASLRVA